MFTSHREKWVDADIVALVELDMRRMRVRFVLAHEAIRERMRELEYPRGHQGGRQRIESALDNCGLETMKQERRTS